MASQHHFELKSVFASREATQIGTLIKDLSHRISIFECHIAAEEKETRIYDPAHFAYSVSARSLAARRDNLRVTIAALEERLARLQADGADVSEQASDFSPSY